MKLPIVLRDEAQAEFDEAFDWYDCKRAVLGPEFVAEIQKVFDRIANQVLHLTWRAFRLYIASSLSAPAGQVSLSFGEAVRQKIRERATNNGVTVWRYF